MTQKLKTQFEIEDLSSNLKPDRLKRPVTVQQNGSPQTTPLPSSFKRIISKQAPFFLNISRLELAKNIRMFPANFKKMQKRAGNV